MGKVATATSTSTSKISKKKKSFQNMPGKQVVGIFADFRREDEGEYVCPRCTIFGLDKEELAKLMHLGIKFTDLNKEEDGYEAHTSIFKLMRELGKNFGFEQHGKPVCTSAPGDRKTLIYTLTKDC